MLRAMAEMQQQQYAHLSQLQPPSPQEGGGGGGRALQQLPPSATPVPPLVEREVSMLLTHSCLPCVCACAYTSAGVEAPAAAAAAAAGAKDASAAATSDSTRHGGGLKEASNDDENKRRQADLATAEDNEASESSLLSSSSPSSASSASSASASSSSSSSSPLCFPSISTVLNSTKVRQAAKTLLGPSPSLDRGGQKTPRSLSHSLSRFRSLSTASAASSQGVARSFPTAIASGSMCWDWAASAPPISSTAPSHCVVKSAEIAVRLTPHGAYANKQNHHQKNQNRTFFQNRKYG